MKYITCSISYLYVWYADTGILESMVSGILPCFGHFQSERSVLVFFWSFGPLVVQASWELPFVPHGPWPEPLTVGLSVELARRSDG